MEKFKIVAVSTVARTIAAKDEKEAKLKMDKIIDECCQEYDSPRQLFYYSMRQHKITCNQLIVLSEIYRGTLQTANCMATKENDIDTLKNLGLVHNQNNDWECTPDGNSYVENCLTVSF